MSTEKTPTGTATRRAVLAGLAATGIGLALPRTSAATPALLTAADRAGLDPSPVFPEGVLAGVPRTDGATLWTRVPRSSTDSNATLALLVSRDPAFTRPEIVTTVEARAAANGAAHFNAVGLRAGEQYFYQFRGRDTASPIGRFQTLRPADSTQPVRIGFFTCQGLSDGYYAAHRHLAAEDLDLVVCLGDYVYEAHDPEGVRPTNQLNNYPQTLEGFRAKYTEYRQDELLREMHQRHAFLPMWDDHEFRNNYDTKDWTMPAEPLFEQKKAWAWQAWFEHMPVPRFNGDPTRTYRSMRLGSTAQFFATDTRQYRDDQPCGDNFGGLAGAAVCTDADNPNRTMLGSTQKSWLLDGLRKSSARWKLLANQNMLMGMVVGDQGERAWLDTWDGYGAERTELLTAASRVENFLVITGDDHDTYGGELWNTGFAPGTTSGAQVNPAGTRRAGVEFVVPSVTSTNTGDASGAEAARAEERSRLGHNPHLKLADMVGHGYGALELGSTAARFEVRVVDKLNPDAGVTTQYTRTVQAGTASIQG